MKTKTQLIEELDDTVMMLVDAVDARNWVVASGAAVHIEALCVMVGKRVPAPSDYVALKDVSNSLSKLGALLEQGSANVVHE